MDGVQFEMSFDAVRFTVHGVKREVVDFALALHDRVALGGIQKVQNTRALVLKSYAEKLETATGEAKLELLRRQAASAANWIADDARARVIHVRVMERIARREGREN